MIRSHLAAAPGPAAPVAGGMAEYRPGACNIGPAEIARRRRTGHVGLVATVLLLVALVALGLPSVTRLLLCLSAAVSAAGYLQAWLKFCAAYGSLGVFNFGVAGRTQQVVDAEARRRDRRRALQISLASLLIGITVGLAAFLLPL
jgi:hypothetical protein